VASLFVFKAVEKPIRDREFSRISLQFPNKPGHIDLVREVFHTHGVVLKNMEMDIGEKAITLRLIVQVPTHLDRAKLLSSLHESGVEHVEW